MSLQRHRKKMFGWTLMMVSSPGSEGFSYSTIKLFSFCVWFNEFDFVKTESQHKTTLLMHIFGWTSWVLLCCCCYWPMLIVFLFSCEINITDHNGTLLERTPLQWNIFCSYFFVVRFQQKRCRDILLAATQCGGVRGVTLKNYTVKLNINVLMERFTHSSHSHKQTSWSIFNVLQSLLA